MPHPRWIPRPRPTLCASLCSRNAHGHVTRAILRENLQGKYHAPDGSRDRDPHFAQACAVEMHMDMSRAILRENAQGKHREHLEKNAAPQMDPETATHCLGEKWHGLVRRCLKKIQDPKLSCES